MKVFSSYGGFTKDAIFFSWLFLLNTYQSKLSSYFLIIKLGHPWICENGVAPDRALDPAVLSRLKQFSAMNKLKKMALRVSASA